MVANVDEQAFHRDLLLQRAVAMTLLIVAETAVQVMTKAPEFALEHPEMTWEDMRGMRNRLAHGYLKMNLHVIYETARLESLRLVSHLDAILSSHAQGE
jgi:uncharacterized protein with HEPN domain